MTISLILLLFVSGFLSGAVNAIAGGGTFLTFGALTLAGIPPISANATSSIVQFPGYVTSTLAYRSEIAKRWRSAIALTLISALGGLGGALILLALDNPSFRAMVPWLLAGATAIFAAGPLLKPKSSEERSASSVLSLFGQFLTSVYGGFFGAGMGIMMLAVLGLTTGGSYHHLNALKNLLATVIAAVAIIVFVSGGVVAWPEAVIMIPAVAAGGYAGVWLARRVPQGIMRMIVVAVGVGLTIYYFVTG
ncbi:sulfite exporter TauE/SafE family protein [Rhizobium sp. SSA_523]|uniref:sulfite exporter TauE/SafE family protein n=1 Tax=Rhizobium sp. SSA_523 TaxID=2952477 RepID=UPI0020902298|nr:sulfite exporter TauE/SafE family protein [Rhizobium sp. SSA_523]MCO5733523.1 sulfite exporter TauE/SafE family protein [Rhizobium sp. SSA_523]WKC23173.1 sulfite exporter TauE/SafE family protein [Rhizobium sp. SSA_523]